MVGLLRKVLKPFIFLFLFVALIAIFGLFIGTVVGTFFFIPASPFFIPGHSLMGYLFSLSGFMTIAIPLMGLFYFFSRKIRPYTISAPARKNLGFAWIVAACFTIYGVIDLATDFKAHNEDFSFQSYDVKLDTIRFNVTDPLGYYGGWYHIGDKRYTGDAIYDDNYWVQLKKSENNQLRIERTVLAAGSNPSDAKKRAKELDHAITFDGEEIRVPSRTSLQRGEKIRDQYVEYTIFIPEGKEIVFDNRTRGRRFSMDFESKTGLPHNFHKYSWMMGSKGFTSQRWNEVSNFRRTQKVAEPTVISIDGEFEIEIIQGEERELVLTGHKSEVERVIVVEHGRTLTIESEDRSFNYPIKVYLKIPKIETLNTNTEQKVRLEGFKQQDLELLFTDNAEVSGFLDVENLLIQAERAIDLDLTGQGKDLILDLDYYSEFNGQNFPVKELILKNRLRKARAKVDDKVWSQQRLPSGIKIYGDPEIIMGLNAKLESLKSESQSIRGQIKAELEAIKSEAKSIKEELKSEAEAIKSEAKAIKEEIRSEAEAIESETEEFIQNM